MVALWLNFATTLNRTLAWLKDRPGSAALIGAVAGPATYLAGARLGAVQVSTSDPLAVLAIAIEWLIALPLLARLARTLTARRRSRTAPPPSEESP